MLCINQNYCDECELFTDLDESEHDFVWMDEDGICLEKYDDCYYYIPYLDEEN